MILLLFSFHATQRLKPFEYFKTSQILTFIEVFPRDDANVKG